MDTSNHASDQPNTLEYIASDQSLAWPLEKLHTDELCQATIENICTNIIGDQIACNMQKVTDVLFFLGGEPMLLPHMPV